MLFCLDCRRELVVVRETERSGAVVELIEDPVTGWVLGPVVKRWRTKGVDAAGEAKVNKACGCG